MSHGGVVAELLFTSDPQPLPFLWRCQDVRGRDDPVPREASVHTMELLQQWEDATARARDAEAALEAFQADVDTVPFRDPATLAGRVRQLSTVSGLLQAVLEHQDHILQALRTPVTDHSVPFEAEHHGYVHAGRCRCLCWPLVTMLTRLLPVRRRAVIKLFRLVSQLLLSHTHAVDNVKWMAAFRADLEAVDSGLDAVSVVSAKFQAVANAHEDIQTGMDQLVHPPRL